MKIPSAIATVAMLLAVTSADRGFKPPAHKDGSGSHKEMVGQPKDKMIKTAANFAKGGAKIDLCPSGDCEKGQLVSLMMSRLEEFGPDGKPTKNKADNFNKLDSDWTPFADMTVGDITVSTTSYIADVPVQKAGTAKFNLTTSIYHGSGSALNGNQSIPVPAGAMKFTVTIQNWPFLSSNNHLRFGVKLKARGKDGKDRPKPEKKQKGDRKDIARVDMGEGMFMDAPAQAVMDGVQGAINSTVEAEGSEVEYVWEFPHFTKSLFYDPVVGSEDPSAVVEDPDDAGATTPKPTTPTPSPKNAAGGLATTVFASCLAAAATALTIF